MEDKYELNFCEKCFQMTNHLNGVCKKCYPKEKYVKCFDKFDMELKDGDVVDVQTAGAHQIYKKKDGQLYFSPYGTEERVSDYFSNDIVWVYRNKF